MGNAPIYITLLLALISGLSIRIALSFAKQNWVRTYHHTMSYLLLPLITMVITKIISGNIALSLGMIGALSIVRFRNPVKSPFELVIFFALITIGIAMAVDIRWGILLTAIIVAVIVMGALLEQLMLRYKINIFAFSFDESHAINIIEVSSNEKIDVLEDSNILIQKLILNVPSKEYHYKLASRNKEEVISLEKTLRENNKVHSLDVRYN
jgi:hypothetical protein|tara:strand:+ start:3680 stop:4309 length:630 start_codon:yes stop_codon:yes gene_type:complete